MIMKAVIYWAVQIGIWLFTVRILRRLGERDLRIDNLKTKAWCLLLAPGIAFAYWFLPNLLGIKIADPELQAMQMPMAVVVTVIIYIALAGRWVRQAKLRKEETSRPNRTSDATSEPAPGADSSAHQG
ncbi:MAG: hypothetical protein PHR35_13150 [Kiritimatiellae bacterium]|nr:hypothetical protein [Kiritimatiellia bacterium]